MSRAARIAAFVAPSALVLVLLVPTARAESCAVFAKSIGVPIDAQTGAVVYQEVVPVEGVKAADLYVRATAAVLSLYKPAKDVTQLADKDTSRLTVKGSYPITTDALGLDRDIVRHTLTIECRDGRYRLTLANLVVVEMTADLTINASPGVTPFEQYTSKAPCFGRKTVVKATHQGALALLAAAKREMAKASPAGSDTW